MHSIYIYQIHIFVFIELQQDLSEIIPEASVSVLSGRRVPEMFPINWPYQLTGTSWGYWKAIISVSRGEFSISVQKDSDLKLDTTVRAQTMVQYK